MCPRKKFDNRITGSRKKIISLRKLIGFQKNGMVELLLSYEFNIVPFSELKIPFSCYVLKENIVTRKKNLAIC